MACTARACVRVRDACVRANICTNAQLRPRQASEASNETPFGTPLATPPVSSRGGEAALLDASAVSDNIDGSGLSATQHAELGLSAMHHAELGLSATQEARLDASAASSDAHFEHVPIGTGLHST